MKHTLFSIFLLTTISISAVANPIWKLNTNNAHEDLATWAKELIETKINQLPDGEYTFTLNQKDDAMTIHYDVVGKDIQGEMSTEYAWDGLESLVEDVCNNIEKQIKSQQNPKVVSQESHKTDVTSSSKPKKEVEKVTQYTSVKSKENTPLKQSSYSTHNTKSTAYPRAIGGTIGGGISFSYQHGFGDTGFLDVNIDAPLFYGIGATVTYNWINPFNTSIPWNGPGHWEWYLGFGGSGGWARYSGFVGAVGEVGIAYNFVFPLQLSLEYKPNFGVAFFDHYAYFNTSGLYSGIALGIRYLLN